MNFKAYGTLKINYSIGKILDRNNSPCFPLSGMELPHAKIIYESNKSISGTLGLKEGKICHFLYFRNLLFDESQHKINYITDFTNKQFRENIHNLY